MQVEAFYEGPRRSAKVGEMNCVAIRVAIHYRLSVNNENC
ncbi:Uncharacterised protein [Mycobacteroides abscessus subsp. abscessus]|nr:Uncharacterised protein [Mycobacteroides abscessus subsp. abscessus]